MLVEPKRLVVFITRQSVAVCVITLLSCSAGTVWPQVPARHPRAIIKKMITRYETLVSYQDSGVVRTLPSEPRVADLDSPHFWAASFQEDTIVSFKTYFKRPGRFRFEWKSSFLRSSREAAIWSDGWHDYLWMPNRPGNGDSFMLYGRGDLEFYFDQAKPSSAGSIFFVPTLLMKEASPFPFANLLAIASELSLLREEQFDGETCYVIKCKMSGVPWTLWVGKNSYLLRKTRTEYISGSFDDKGAIRNSLIAEEIHRDIRINRKIPDAVFQYKPKLLPNDIDLTRK